MDYRKPVSTPMITHCKLRNDDNYLKVDHAIYIYIYIYMIGIPMYVESTRPNVMQFVGLATRFQSSPTYSNNPLKN